jgi:hypothetical protein
MTCKDDGNFLACLTSRLYGSERSASLYGRFSPRDITTFLMKPLVPVKRNKIACQFVKSTFTNKFRENHLSNSGNELCRRQNRWPFYTRFVLKKCIVNKMFTEVHRWCKCNGGRQWLLIGVISYLCCFRPLN